MMLNKMYVKTKEFLKGNYRWIIFAICLFLVLTYPVPYYIFTSGGISSLSERFEVENSYEQKGSYNLSYVSQLEGNVVTYLLSYLVPSWDLVEVSDYQISSNESIEELAIRDKLSLEQANQTAIELAYRKAGKSFQIEKTHLYIALLNSYVDASEKIKIGDEIISIDGEEVEDFESLAQYIGKQEVGKTVDLELSRGDSTYHTMVKVQDIEGNKVTGIAVIPIYDYRTNPKITIKFHDNESGASAGFMTTLAIYDALLEEDLTRGLKIAGTGTIDEEGNVGEIGGVRYKLKGAVAKDADIFFVPYGENYEECLKLKEEKDYDIEIVGISTLDEAIAYLGA